MGYDATPTYGLRTPQGTNRPMVASDLKQLAEDTDKAIGQSVTSLSGLQGNITSMQGEITTLRASVNAVATSSGGGGGSGDWQKAVDAEVKARQQAVSSEASTRASEDSRIRSDASALTSRVSAVEGKVTALERSSGSSAPVATGGGLAHKGVIPNGADVTSLDEGIYYALPGYITKGITGLPADSRPERAGILEVYRPSSSLVMLRWSSGSYGDSAKPTVQSRWKISGSWGAWA